MKSASFSACLIVIVALNHLANADDPPAVSSLPPNEMIVGSWQDRAEKDDAIIAFSADGSGTITERTAGKDVQANVTWKMERAMGNACIILIEFEGPKPKGVKPLTWLLAFDGSDTFVLQPTENKIVFMDRRK